MSVDDELRALVERAECLSCRADEGDDGNGEEISDFEAGELYRTAYRLMVCAYDASEVLRNRDESIGGGFGNCCCCEDTPLAECKVDAEALALIRRHA